MIRKSLVALGAMLSLGLAQAAPVFYTFSGHLDGVPPDAISGQTSFDDGTLALLSLDFTFQGREFHLDGAEPDTAYLVFSDGQFLGLNGVFIDDFGTVSLFPGSDAGGTPYFAFENSDGGRSGDLSYQAVGNVPEPASLALLTAGFIGAGAARRRRA